MLTQFYRQLKKIAEACIIFIIIINPLIAILDNNKLAITNNIIHFFLIALVSGIIIYIILEIVVKNKNKIIPIFFFNKFLCIFLWSFN